MAGQGVMYAKASDDLLELSASSRKAFRMRVPNPQRAGVQQMVQANLTAIRD